MPSRPRPAPRVAWLMMKAYAGHDCFFIPRCSGFEMVHKFAHHTGAKELYDLVLKIRITKAYVRRHPDSNRRAAAATRTSDPNSRATASARISYLNSRAAAAMRASDPNSRAVASARMTYLNSRAAETMRISDNETIASLRVSVWPDGDADRTGIETRINGFKNETCGHLKENTLFPEMRAFVKKRSIPCGGTIFE